MKSEINATILNGDYFSSKGITFDIPVEIHFSRFGDANYRHQLGDVKINFKHISSFKVFVCSNEPVSSRSRETTENIINNAHKYDLILTSEKKILQSVSNSVLFSYGTTWLNKDKNHLDSLGVFDESIFSSTFQNKKFEISFLSTSHLGKEGYNYRCIIWNNKHVFRCPTKFYSSTRFPTNNGVFSNTLHDGMLPNDDKINLFNSQFSIAIESSVEESYFTEKLIDCLLTKTVPVYLGCPNISDFFDTRGMVVVSSVKELVEKINTLTDKTYDSMKPYIEENYKRAQKYGSFFFERIKNEINLYRLNLVEQGKIK